MTSSATSRWPRQVLPLLHRARAHDDETAGGSSAWARSPTRSPGRWAAPARRPAHAIEAITDAWRRELDPEGLAVVLIEPSAILTPL